MRNGTMENLANRYSAVRYWWWRVALRPVALWMLRRFRAVYLVQSLEERASRIEPEIETTHLGLGDTKTFLVDGPCTVLIDRT